MRANSGYEAYLNAIENSVFMEVLDIVRNHTLTKGRSLEETAELAQKMFGVACDNSPEGERLHLEAKPFCESCKSNNVEFFSEPLQPTQISSIPNVSNKEWELLDSCQRISIIEKELKKYL